ncbi:MAG: hypothetical protein WAM94_12635, partial [Chromatiaceae bacterium]
MFARPALVVFGLAWYGLFACASAGEQKLNTPPKGFRLLFDGKTLDNWKGQIAEDPRRVAKLTMGLADEQIKQLQEAADQKTFAHWKAED